MAPTARLIRRSCRNLVIGQVGLACLFTLVGAVPFYAAMMFGVCVGYGAVDLAEWQERRTLEREDRERPAP